MIISISLSAGKGRSATLEPPRFRSLIVSHLLIRLSDHSAMPPALQQPVRVPIKEKGAQRFCDSEREMRPAICRKWKWDSGCRFWVPAWADPLLADVCLRLFCLFLSVVPLVPSRQNAVGAELKGQWAAAVEEHLKIHLFEDFRNAWGVSFCLRHQEFKTEHSPNEWRGLWAFFWFLNLLYPIF